jgi:hypothetical protein
MRSWASGRRCKRPQNGSRVCGKGWEQDQRIGIFPSPYDGIRQHNSRVRRCSRHNCAALFHILGRSLEPLPPPPPLRCNALSDLGKISDSRLRIAEHFPFTSDGVVFYSSRGSSPRMPPAKSESAIWPPDSDLSIFRPSCRHRVGFGIFGSDGDDELGTTWPWAMASASSELPLLVGRRDQRPGQP